MKNITKDKIIKRLEYLCGQYTLGSWVLPYLTEQYLDEQITTHYLPVMDNLPTKEETLKVIFDKGVDLTQFLDQKTIDELYVCLRLYARLLKNGN